MSKLYKKHFILVVGILLVGLLIQPAFDMQACLASEKEARSFKNDDNRIEFKENLRPSAVWDKDFSFDLFHHVSLNHCCDTVFIPGVTINLSIAPSEIDNHSPPCYS